MKTEGLEELDIYIYRRKNTMEDYITTKLIMYLWLEEEKNLGERVSKQCWGHMGMSLVSAREDTEAEVTGEADG